MINSNNDVAKVDIRYSLARLYWQDRSRTWATQLLSLAFVSTDSKRLVVYFKRKLVSKEHKQAKDSIGLRIPMD